MKALLLYLQCGFIWTCAHAAIEGDALAGVIIVFFLGWVCIGARSCIYVRTYFVYACIQQGNIEEKSTECCVGEERAIEGKAPNGSTEAASAAATAAGESGGQLEDSFTNEVALSRKCVHSHPLVPS